MYHTTLSKVTYCTKRSHKYKEKEKKYCRSLQDCFIKGPDKRTGELAKPRSRDRVTYHLGVSNRPRSKDRVTNHFMCIKQAQVKGQGN